jgi:hypothetical protein
MSSIAPFIVDEFNSAFNKKENVAITFVLKDYNPSQLNLVVNEISLLDVDTIYIRGLGGDEKQPYRMIIRADIINQFVMYSL